MCLLCLGRHRPTLHSCSFRIQLNHSIAHQASLFILSACSSADFVRTPCTVWSSSFSHFVISRSYCSFSAFIYELMLSSISFKYLLSKQTLIKRHHWTKNAFGIVNSTCRIFALQFSTNIFDILYVHLFFHLYRPAQRVKNHATSADLGTRK